jgi:hypothetical protein
MIGRALAGYIEITNYGLIKKKMTKFYERFRVQQSFTKRGIINWIQAKKGDF